jgi:CRISPR-associated protein Cas1
MIGRIIEIAEDGRHLAVSRGFLVIRDRDSELGRVPLDDIGAVIANGHGLSYSNNVLLALVERNAPVVLCGANHAPAALVWPVASHHLQNARMRAQIELSGPKAKRLWQSVVRAKIGQQAAVLELMGRKGQKFDLLVRRVRSGDPDNVEAQAARRYWPLMFGREFRRDRTAEGINSLLNYGYTVLRAATARAVMSVGLHPTFGLHHRSRGNPMCLVDDFMEPFRPIVDLLAARLAGSGHDTVSRETKPVLAAVASLDLASAAGTTPLSTCLIRLASSFARICEGERGRLEFPLGPLPLELPPLPAVRAQDASQEPTPTGDALRSP